jgi:hypothetical protein
LGDADAPGDPVVAGRFVADDEWLPAGDPHAASPNTAARTAANPIRAIPALPLSCGSPQAYNRGPRCAVPIRLRPESVPDRAHRRRGRPTSPLDLAVKSMARRYHSP